MQLLINQLQNISNENFHFFHFLIPFTLTMIVMPVGVKILTFFKIMDIPNTRKVHKSPIPSTGGILIFFCFLASTMILIPFHSLIPAYLIGSSFLVFIGLMDDINPISPYIKFMTQILAGFIFISITKITFIIPGFENSFFLSFSITLFFIVSVTNALNLIDGMDGLASGISIIILSVISIYTGFQHSLISIMLGIFFITSVSPITSILVKKHEMIKGSYERDKNYLAAITENGIWIKEKKLEINIL